MRWCGNRGAGVRAEIRPMTQSHAPLSHYLTPPPRPASLKRPLLLLRYRASPPQPEIRRIRLRGRQNASAGARAVLSPPTPRPLPPPPGPKSPNRTLVSGSAGESRAPPARGPCVNSAGRAAPPSSPRRAAPVRSREGSLKWGEQPRDLIGLLAGGRGGDATSGSSR